MSIPENFLKASGIFVLAPGSGGPLTTTLPSVLADANNASQPDGAGAAPCGAVGGALVVPHATTTPPARPTPTNARPLSNCRRLTRPVFNMCTPPSLVRSGYRTQYPILTTRVIMHPADGRKNIMVLTREENDFLTRVGPGTPAGELLRRYWMPVAVAAELTPEQPTKFVRLLGENLVLFRDKLGRVGLIADRCAHRGASMCYGRVEQRGIACAYH